MKYLAIDTSGDYLTVVCRNGDIVKSHFSLMAGVKHSVSLMPVIEEVSALANLDLKDVDFFSSTTGPGSFTGIRIGVSTIKGFADAYSKPVLPVTTLEVIAYNKISDNRLALIDAKHGNFYAEGYTGDQVTFPAKFINKEDVVSLQKSYKLIANGLMDGLLVETVDLVKGLVSAVEANLNRVSDDVDALHPFYLRLSQAEEGRK